MTLSHLDKKRQEYGTELLVPEANTFESFSNRIYGLKLAILAVIKPIKGRKQSIVEAIQKDLLKDLEEELTLIEKNPEYIRLREEEHNKLIVNEQDQGENSIQKLHEKNIARIEKIIASTPFDAPIAKENSPASGINVADWDLFYQDWFLKAIANTGNIKFPGTNKEPKKIVVTNLPELYKNGFFKGVLPSKHGDGMLSGQYNMFLERGYIVATIYFGGSLNCYYAIHFDCRNEGTTETYGTLNFTYLSMLETKNIKPDIKIEHSEYIEYKRKSFKI